MPTGCPVFPSAPRACGVCPCPWGSVKRGQADLSHREVIGARDGRPDPHARARPNRLWHRSWQLCWYVARGQGGEVLSALLAGWASSITSLSPPQIRAKVTSYFCY